MVRVSYHIYHLEEWRSTGAALTETEGGHTPCRQYLENE